MVLLWASEVRVDASQGVKVLSQGGIEIFLLNIFRRNKTAQVVLSEIPIRTQIYEVQF